MKRKCWARLLRVIILAHLVVTGVLNIYISLGKCDDIIWVMLWTDPNNAITFFHFHLKEVCEHSRQTLSALCSLLKYLHGKHHAMVRNDF